MTKTTQRGKCMYIVFIDESGQPGGFMIDADNILNIEVGLKDIKIKYGLEPSHEIKWHTTYSNYGLNFEQYEQMRYDIVKLISKNNNIYGPGIKFYK